MNFYILCMYMYIYIYLYIHIYLYLYLYTRHSVVSYYTKSKPMYDIQAIHTVIFYVLYFANGRFVQTSKGTNKHKCIQAEDMGISWAYFLP